MTGVSLVFTRRPGVLSKGLQLFLWSQWSHVGVADPIRGTVIEAVFGKGVREVPAEEMLRGTSHSEIVIVPSGNPEAVIEAARSQVGKPYDTLGALGIAARRRWQDDDSWFCSELVAYAFMRAGEPKFKVDAWRITPRDLYIPNW